MVQKNSKEVNLRHKKILEDLLKLEENKECADCNNKGPLWASTNIGVFLCIKCAGCHRNLGTHISTVRSVNLDEWTPQQISNIVEKGNSKVNMVYEANLDPRNKPDLNTDDRTRENFIKAKYDRKEFYAKSGKTEKVEKVKIERVEEEKKERKVIKKKEEKKEIVVEKVVKPENKKTDSLIQFNESAPTSSMNDLFGPSTNNFTVNLNQQSQSAPTTPQDRKKVDDIFGTQITNVDLISLTDNTTKKQNILSIFDQQPQTKTGPSFQGGFNQQGPYQGGFNHQQGGFNQQGGFKQQQQMFQQIPMNRPIQQPPQRNPYVVVNNNNLLDKKF